MTELRLSVGEPFTSPAWGSNFVVFSSGEIVQEDSSKEYLNRVCKYARSFQVYLVPERFMLMDYQCMCLISPAGKVIGAQKGLFVSGLNRGGKHSGSLETIITEFGSIFLSVDVDIYQPEVARIASAMGAQYIISSQFIAEGDYNSSMVLTGSWNAAQSGNLYVISACNQFNCVSAPLSLTKHNDGFLIQPNLKLPLTAKLTADALLTCKPPFHLSRRFYAIHRSELIG